MATTRPHPDDIPPPTLLPEANDTLRDLHIKWTYALGSLAAAAAGAGDTDDDVPTLEEIRDAINLLTGNADQTHVLVGGTGAIPAGLKSVSIVNLTGVTEVVAGFSISQDPANAFPPSIDLAATESDRSRPLLPAINPNGGTWQWIGFQPVAEA